MSTIYAKNTYMLVAPENYKGICFVRISNLPTEQKSELRRTYSKDSIIKILMEDALVNDCVLYTDYEKWYRQFKNLTSQEIKPLPVPELILSPAVVD